MVMVMPAMVVMATLHFMFGHEYCEILVWIVFFSSKRHCINNLDMIFKVCPNFYKSADHGQISKIWTNDFLIA